MVVHRFLAIVCYVTQVSRHSQLAQQDFLIHEVVCTTKSYFSNDFKDEDAKSSHLLLSVSLCLGFLYFSELQLPFPFLLLAKLESQKYWRNGRDDEPREGGHTWIFSFDRTPTPNCELESCSLRLLARHCYFSCVVLISLHSLPHHARLLYAMHLPALVFILLTS